MEKSSHKDYVEAALSISNISLSEEEVLKVAAQFALLMDHADIVREAVVPGQCETPLEFKP